MSWLCSQVQDLFGGVPGELLDMYGGQPDVEIVGAQESLGDSGGGGGPGEVRRSSAFHAWNDPGPRTFIGRSRRPNVRRRWCSRTPGCSSWWSVDLSMTTWMPGRVTRFGSPMTSPLPNDVVTSSTGVTVV